MVIPGWERHCKPAPIPRAVTNGEDWLARAYRVLENLDFRVCLVLLSSEEYAYCKTTPWFEVETQAAMFVPGDVGEVWGAALVCHPQVKPGEVWLVGDLGRPGKSIPGVTICVWHPSPLDPKKGDLLEYGLARLVLRSSEMGGSR